MTEDHIAITDHWGEHRLRLLRYGNAGASRQVVCVHGLTRNGFDFAPLATALAACGYSVIVPDMVGRGGSSWLADPRGYTVETYADHMLALLDRLELARVDWVGTSMGGLIALQMASMGRFRSLVLNDIGPFVPQSALQMIASYLALDLQFDDPTAIEAHLRQIHAPFGPLSDAQWQHLARHSARREGERWRLHYDPEIRRNFAEAAKGDIDLWPLWEAVTCPTLLIRGTQSLLLDSATLARMAQGRDHVETFEVEGVGHAPALMDTTQIARLQAFLAGVSA